MQRMRPSARGYRRVLKLSGTISGLVGNEGIQPAHLAFSNIHMAGVPTRFR